MPPGRGSLSQRTPSLSWALDKVQLRGRTACKRAGHVTCGQVGPAVGAPSLSTQSSGRRHEGGTMMRTPVGVLRTKEANAMSARSYVATHHGALWFRWLVRLVFRAPDRLRVSAIPAG